MINISKEEWPFTDPKNVAVFSTQKIVTKESPILFVSHDSDDGAWQFQSGNEVAEDEPKVVSLARIIKIDPKIKELADLPLGWVATRADPESPWQCFKLTEDSSKDDKNDLDP